MVDELLVSLHDFSLVLLPILGALVLAYVVALLRKVISVFSHVDALLTSVDHKVEKLDGPLDTLVRLSHSVDMVHEATIKGTRGIVQYGITHWSSFKDWFNDIVHKSNDDDPIPHGNGPESVQDSKGDA